MMRFEDDIRRHTVSTDYDGVIEDLLRAFGRDDVTICSYGGRRPPISDLDLMVLTDPAASPRQVRRLRTRLNKFRSANPLRRYLVDDEIRLCPLDVFCRVRVKHPNMLPASFQVLSGPAVGATPEPATAQATQVVLVDAILTRLNELSDMRRQTVVSVREILKTLQKLSTFVRPQIAQVIALEHRSYADDVLQVGYDAVAARVEQLRERAVAGPTDSEVHASLEECLQQAQTLLGDSLEVYCLGFLQSVITPSTSREHHASEGREETLPELVLCHIAAYAQTSHGPSALRERLRLAGTVHQFTITDDTYRGVLAGQMDAAALFDDCFRRLGIPAFPLAIAGEWHCWEPRGRWDMVRRIVDSARQQLGLAGGADRS